MSEFLKHYKVRAKSVDHLSIMLDKMKKIGYKRVGKNLEDYTNTQINYIIINQYRRTYGFYYSYVHGMSMNNYNEIPMKGEVHKVSNRIGTGRPLMRVPRLAGQTREVYRDINDLILKNPKVKKPKIYQSISQSRNMYKYNWRYITLDEYNNHKQKS